MHVIFNPLSARFTRRGKGAKERKRFSFCHHPLFFTRHNYRKEEKGGGERERRLLVEIKIHRQIKHNHIMLQSVNNYVSFLIPLFCSFFSRTPLNKIRYTRTYSDRNGVESVRQKIYMAAVGFEPTPQ